jgi:hypothetical protein
MGVTGLFNNKLDTAYEHMIFLTPRSFSPNLPKGRGYSSWVFTMRNGRAVAGGYLSGMPGRSVSIPEIAGAKVAHDDIGANRIIATRRPRHGMSGTGN